MRNNFMPGVVAGVVARLTTAFGASPKGWVALTPNSVFSPSAINV